MSLLKKLFSVYIILLPYRELSLSDFFPDQSLPAKLFYAKQRTIYAYGQHIKAFPFAVIQRQVGIFRQGSTVRIFFIKAIIKSYVIYLFVYASLSQFISHDRKSIC